MCPAAQTQRLVYDIKVEVRWSLSAFTSSVCVLRFLKQDVFLTLSLSFSFSLSIALFSPSSSRSISLTVSPDRVLNFFLRNKSSEREERRRWSQSPLHPRTELPRQVLRPDVLSTVIIMTTNDKITSSCRRLGAIHFVQSSKSDEHYKQNTSQRLNNRLRSSLVYLRL